ncbi:MAG: hypothetical protein H3C54_10665 [Taibaiella sp.]|nr:hypothetical protein [Taibaiella sp.]
MRAIIKYNLLLCMLLSCLHRGYANKIDSLTTKEEVQAFLAANLGESGVAFPLYCVDISQTEKIKMYLSEDISVEDPVTREVVLRTRVSVEPDSNDNCCKDYPFVNEKFSDIAPLLNNDSFRIYKADLDGNGYTDIVVDGGIIVVVMDMIDRVEGYMFTPIQNVLRLEHGISLPDKSNAFLLKYKHCGADTAAVDTIVYKYNAFVKYNPHYKSVGIRKINYYFSNSSDMVCIERQSCMEINKDGRCYLKYADPPFEPGRYDTTFSATLDSKQVSELWSLIGYINVNSKKDAYAHWINHGEGGTFVFYFDDGTVKRITVWATIPPISLRYLSKNIAGISRELKWSPSLSQPDFECPREYVGYENNSDCSGLW